MSTLIELRDEAIDTNKAAHERIRMELNIYQNNAYGTSGHKIGRVKSQAGESLDPKVRKGVNRLMPGFIEQMSRIEVQPDATYRIEDDMMLCEDLQNWLDMNDDASDEGEDMEVLIKHNLALGHAVCKVGWDARQMIATAIPVSPLQIFVDPGCRKVNMSDAEYMVHREMQTVEYVKRFYPDFDIGRVKIKEPRKDSQVVAVDELWIRPEKAEACGVEVDVELGGVLVAVFINDEFHKIRHSPYWWPDFPFCSWRNFIDINDMSGKPNEFWGYGYGTQLWTNQKLLDEIMANLVLISRNQAVGRFISPLGMLDMEQVLPIHGLNIEYDKESGYKLEDIMHLPPDQVPPVLFNVYQELSAQMDSQIPSLSDTFTGEEPSNASSGRAINALQYASFSQLSHNIRAMNEFRRRRTRMKLTMIQQYANRPLLPHQWRGGMDLPDFFPEDARHVSYELTYPDLSSMPNTPAGRMQVVVMLTNMVSSLVATGVQVTEETIERLMEFIGIDKGFGLRAGDFLPAMAPGLGAGMPGAGGAVAPEPDSQVVSGLEAASMKAEQ